MFTQCDDVPELGERCRRCYGHVEGFQRGGAHCPRCPRCRCCWRAPWRPEPPCLSLRAEAQNQNLQDFDNFQSRKRQLEELREASQALAEPRRRRRAGPGGAHSRTRTGKAWKARSLRASHLQRRMARISFTARQHDARLLSQLSDHVAVSLFDKRGRNSTSGSSLKRRKGCWPNNGFRALCVTQFPGILDLICLAKPATFRTLFQKQVSMIVGFCSKIPFVVLPHKGGCLHNTSKFDGACSDL